jgi:hypothetical protein
MLDSVRNRVFNALGDVAPPNPLEHQGRKIDEPGLGAGGRASVNTRIDIRKAD